jgi:ABC-type sugar transport system ATPase subunit
MRDGRLDQVDSPQRLYEQPENMFVAGCIGSPSMNLLRGAIDEAGIVRGGQRVRLPRRTTHRGDVVVGIRRRRWSRPTATPATTCSNCRWC